MFNNVLFMGGASTAPTPGAVDYSCLFEADDSPYLEKTFGSGSGTTWTFSVWFKLSNIPSGGPDAETDICLISAWDGDAARNPDSIIFSGETSLKVVSAGTSMFDSQQIFRDPTAWTHLVVASDLTESTDTDKLKVYVNGNQLTLEIGSLPAEWTYFNSACLHRIGERLKTNDLYWDGYMGQVAWVNGNQLGASSFGEFDSNGLWRPVNITGLTYPSTNSFLLNFGDSSSLGNDISGNENDFTSSGLSSTDQIEDTPTSNYAVLSPLTNITMGTVSEGNLKVVLAAGGAGSGQGKVSTIKVPSSGKWYWEGTLVSTTGSGGTFGLTDGDVPVKQKYLTKETGFWYGFGDGNKYDHSGTGTSIGTTFTTSDKFMVAVDMDNTSVWWGKNGSWLADGNPAANTNAMFTNLTDSDGYFAAFLNEETSGSDTILSNFGQLGFNYSIPTNFKALNAYNLPTPTIEDGTTNYQGTLYTGTGVATSIEQSGNSTFQPDFVWIKNRDDISYHMLIDAARGVTKEINSNDSSAESTDTDGLVSFDSSGFGLGTGADGYNDNSEDFIAWQWKGGGGAGDSNEDGSINTITTSANSTAGISISTYTGTGVAATVGHGLGSIPKMVIVKNIGQIESWGVYHGDVSDATSQDLFLLLDTDAAQGNGIAYWNDTSPTSSVFSIGTGNNTNESGEIHVAYCFAEKEGFSSFGYYKSFSSGPARPMVVTSFRPSFLLIKRVDATSNWFIFDNSRNPYNYQQTPGNSAGLASRILFPNETDAGTGGPQRIDFLSNGFRVVANRDSFEPNMSTASGSRYIYAAFAAHPFGGSGLTPSTAV